MEGALTGFSSDHTAGENTILLPEHASLTAGEIDAALREFGMTNTVVFQTSGTSGDARLVVHSKAGLAASAAAVNEHLQSDSADVWLLVLPEFHVGGFGVAARSKATNSVVYAMDVPWEAERFVEACNEHSATLTSLVPTQVYDLAELGCSCPDSLRAVLVGGGHLDSSLEARARALGWPILRTYGLSEAGSQVATQDGNELLVLPHLEARITTDGRLKLRGSSMALGYLCLDSSGKWQFDQLLSEDGWFQTDDIVELEGRVLRFLGRSSTRVKVLGELVDVEALERAFLAQAGALDAAILAVSDKRAEHALHLVIHSDLSREHITSLVEAFNASVTGFERISKIVEIDNIPRSELGKIRREALRKLVQKTEK